MIYIIFYKLNQYVPIIKGKDGYIFGNEGYFSFSKSNTLKLNIGQEKVFKKLIKGKRLSKDEVYKGFGTEVYKFLIENHILVSHEVDTDSIYSRSKAFYFFNKLGNLQSVLDKKRVLILGVGGIGSHVAWNMTVLGVGEITLVDFDYVEESNLNRQLLYGMDDLGKLKVEVLKDKILKINPQINVNTMAKKIWSEGDLEKIVGGRKYDLIIKSLDSPAEFPAWLDKIALKYNIPYISGITVSSSPMIGPTYIPNISSPYSDFFEEEEAYIRVSGISQSLGVVMYHISSEISMEAFKILSRKGKLKYLNCIEIEDVLNNKVLKLTPKKTSKSHDENVTIDKNIYSIMFILCLMWIRAISDWPIITALTYIYSIIWPFVIYRTRKKINQTCFINLTIFLMLNIVYLIVSGSLLQNYSQGNIPIVLVSLFLGVSINIIFALLITDIIYYLFKEKRNDKIKEYY